MSRVASQSPQPPPSNTHLKVRSSIVKTSMPHLYGSIVLFSTTQAIDNTFQDPSIFELVSQDPATIVTSLVGLLQQQHSKAYRWAVGPGRQLPAGYTLAKRKKAFQSGRPIISFVDSPFRPMLNILARMIFQLIPVACPDLRFW